MHAKALEGLVSFSHQAEVIAQNKNGGSRGLRSVKLYLQSV